MPTSRLAVAAVLVGSVALTACGDTIPGFYSEGAETEALVDDCVDYVQMAAFAGNPDMRRMWDGAGQDAGILRDQCAALADNDRELLETYARNKRVLVREMSSTDTSPTNVIDDVTSGPNCNPNYAGVCLPFDEDVDCLPGDGDGPWFIEKTVIVMGEDEFDLDDDDDGLGCEPGNDISTA